jgi:hypothetical protein
MTTALGNDRCVARCGSETQTSDRSTGGSSWENVIANGVEPLADSRSRRSKEVKPRG